MKRLISLALMLLPLCSWAQHQLSGRVLDAETDQPLAGATVRITESRQLTATDLDGYFRFETKEADDLQLRISFVGYESQELVANAGKPLTINLKPKPFLTDEIIVSATRATDKTPTTYTEVAEEEIEKQNFGQDIPFLLNFTPSIVTTSDAGAGIGYTGLRIRGSDATRINVTVNGIPLNDAESHGVFWVNMPDFASSVENIQVQRGVGSSTNGAASFGASVNIQTSLLNEKAYADIDNSYGSFNSRKHTVRAGTGLLNNRFALDARLSKISSDGYIDRASSNLQSYYLSGGYYGKNSLIKVNIFGGKEKTYQSWWGTPEAVVDQDPEAIADFAARNFITGQDSVRLFTDGRTYNYYTYENETDNYQQDHYQLIGAHDFSPELSGQLAFHYTYGRGYYEQYRADDDLADYPVLGAESVQVNGEIISSMDLIRRRWLDNDFYGTTFALDYHPGELQFVLGGGWNRYEGAHFGELIWTEYALNSQLRDRYYDNDAEKTDFNTYLKVYFPISDQLQAYVDQQYRRIDYSYLGIDADQRFIEGDHTYNFYNPKLGATYQLNPATRLYGSFAIGQREPVRNDFIDAPQGRLPKKEVLRNLEVGYEGRISRQLQLAVNYYLMDYKDQLVLTGELNDVGSAIRMNVPESYRTGLELQLGYQPTAQWLLQGNATFSRNKIEAFEEVLYIYGEETSELRQRYEDTNIAFSPEIIAGGSLSYFPLEGMQLAILSKYVGQQYLDNTETESRSIDAYWVNDFRFNYTTSLSFLKELRLGLLVNNLFNTRYSANGYTFGYGYPADGQDVLVYENYLYPQAGTNFMLSVGIGF